MHHYEHARPTLTRQYRMGIVKKNKPRQKGYIETKPENTRPENSVARKQAHTKSQITHEMQCNRGSVGEASVSHKERRG